jgi:uncharacterized protein
MNSALLGLFILLSYTLEAMTGFGSIVIALSLGALFIPIPELLAILVPLNIALSGYLVATQRAHIQWSLLLRVIAPLMLLGTLAGTWLRPILGDRTLASLFALLIMVFGARELCKSLRGRPEQPHPRWRHQLLIGGAGLTHGLFASGGPLLVFALAGQSLNKAQLRATLLTVWLTLNSLLTGIFLWQGALHSAWPKIALYLPLLILGLVMGERLHHQVSEVLFKRWVYAVLTITGGLLFLRALL